ncbi:MAG: pirin family protein [Calditrichaeota bacterium]|nr:MAG: pirin family protein [Calditrichota bacterium]MBL1207011.1 pirin family protein [Calditrichota bacterium]NOG46838.1 pirin family protein [Calditrichota bacterium]
MSNKIIKNIKPLGMQWETLDPFLFCAHHLDLYPAGNDQLGPAVPLDGRNIGQDFAGKDGWNMYHGNIVPGFPAHPHRGFETVTIVTKGLVDHSDSLGATGRFGNGDVQWLTSGRGVQHSEMFPLLNKDSNHFELFQLWLNLPGKSKMAEPHYKMLWRDEIPKIIKNDSSGNKTTIDLIAGFYEDQKSLEPTPDSWAADAENEVQIWLLKMDGNAQFEIPVAKDGVNRALYFYDGESLTISGTEIKSKQMIELNPQNEIIIKNSSKPASIMFLQGRPINEPVVQYGPFVMNSQEEIQQTMRDYQSTQFGGWPWPRADHVHEKDKGRFAIHANGKEEIK